MIVSDDREVHKRYSDEKPFFGTAPGALLEGLAQVPCNVHVISLFQAPLKSPTKLAENIYFHPVVVPRWGWLRGGYLGCVKALRQKLSQLNAQIVHGQGTERYCALGAALSGRPNVVTIHGNMRRIARLAKARPFTFQWLTARLERFVLPRTGGVICPSSHTCREVARLTRRTWVVPNAVDASFFTLEREQLDNPVILCIADIYSVKNQIGLIRALDPLARSCQFKLRFVGRAIPDDPYTQEFRAMLRVRSWCEYEGFVDRTTIKSHLRRASVVVLPSFEENCPMAILEAMAAGVPVVASRVGGIPDLIEHSATGLLFDPTDEAAICDSVAAFLHNPQLAAKIAAFAKKAAAVRFHPQQIARDHIAIYSEVVAGGRKGFPAQLNNRFAQRLESSKL